MSCTCSTVFAEIEFRLVVRADHLHDPGALAAFIGSRDVEDPRATKFKAADMVELRFVDEMKKSGFVEKLYGRK